MQKKRIIIIGGGFAGINLAAKLSDSNYEVIVIDRNNYHNFQPLLYQVATGGLEPDSIAYPLRRIFREMKNVKFRMANVKVIHPENNTIETSDETLEYDELVIATGSTTNFFGLEPDKNLLMPLKSVPDALNLRSYLLQNLEKAYATYNDRHVEELINVAIVGGGPTGVELAGSLAEMKRYILPKDFPGMSFENMQINLYEAAPRLLSGMSPRSSEKAVKYLEKMGVNVHLNNTVLKYIDEQLILRNGDMFPTKTVIWTAGVKARIPEGLAPEAVNQWGRLQVNEFNQINTYSNIYAIGDVSAYSTEDYPRGLPMQAPAAMQHGRHLAKNLILKAEGKEMQPFKYFNKGAMATVGTNKAVVDFRKLHFGGIVAWFAWMFIHLLYLVGFRNKMSVLFSWAYSYVTYDKALRIIIRPYKMTKPEEKEPV
jgi:NADH dehydrogenase